MALKYLLLNETGLLNLTTNTKSFLFEFSTFTPNLFSKYYPEQKSCSLWRIWLPVLRMIFLSVDSTKFIFLSFSLTLSVRMLNCQMMTDRWKEGKGKGKGKERKKERKEVTREMERVKDKRNCQVWEQIIALFLSKRIQRELRLFMAHSYQIKVGSTCKKSSQSHGQASDKIFIKEK